ncbi:hypothetical protein OEZ86_009235 [Tetradesmus obliquus]|nr:hypothetical protein OEZ86_009235 [Tetradesmus obliquus]
MLRSPLLALLRPILYHNSNGAGVDVLLRRCIASAAPAEEEDASRDASSSQTAADEAAAAAAAAAAGKRSAPLLVPFSLTPTGALAAFVRYQKSRCFSLHAGDLLGAGYSLQPAFLPFYLFEAVISAEAIATLGRRVDKSSKSSPLVWSKMQQWQQISSQLLLPRTEPCMQVYASYRLRRDLAEAAKPAPSTLEAALSVAAEDMMHQQVEAAVAHFKQHSGADDVRDLQVRLTVHRRSVRLAYLPAYHLHYVHGEKYTPSRADIVPAEYDAVIGGAACGKVAAELHPSPVKSQAAAAAAVGSLGLGVMPLTSLALGLDPGLAALAGADTVLLAVLAGTAAGALASRLPLIARNRHAAEQAAAERKFYRQYDQRETAYGSAPDEHTLWLWKDSDWRKWEQEERWAWDPVQRKKWAEELFRQQGQRQADRLAAAKQQEQKSKQRDEDEARESKREARFGRSRHHHAGHAGHGHHQESGARMAHQQHGNSRRRRDFLGYYKALGINLEEASAAISSDAIKSHYKAAALKLHPDKHVHADEATQKRSAERFRRLQLAYETLRDAEKRRAYDRGQLKRSAERFRRLQLAYETLRDAEKRRAYDRGQLVQQ